MSQPGSVAWLALHELRMSRRDLQAMLTAGKRSGESVLAAVVVGYAAVMHVVAWVLLSPVVGHGAAPSQTMLVAIAASAFLSWTLMLSQAIESVSRAFYSRADLDLILSSPVSARRVFAVRIAAIALTTTALATVLFAPFIDVAALAGGARWLAAYAVLLSMGALSTALAVALAVAIFRTFGPRRTRLVSQIVAAVVGAAFVIGVQATAILSTGTLSRFSLMRSEQILAFAPGAGSPIWLPARAAMGEPVALTIVLAVCFGALGLAIAAFAAGFGELVVAASGAPGTLRDARPRTLRFRQASPAATLRRKEWRLLRRDPWLLSQTLMQILYLLPLILFLWIRFNDEIGVLLVLVPVLVMAAGQLSGGLAWITVSGEDAPDLAASAPVNARAIVRAKVEVVFGVIATVTAPLLAALLFAAPRLALAAAAGVAVATFSGTMIQFWFRDRARPGRLRRRQIPSRVATLGEALSAILWAGTATLVAAGIPLVGAVTAAVALIVVGSLWLIRPREEGGG